MSIKKRMIFGLFMAVCAALLAVALFDFSPQQSHWMTTHYAMESNNLIGTFGSTVAFWLFRIFGGAAALLPLIPFLLFCTLLLPKKFPLWHVFFALNFTIFGTIFLSWLQTFFALQPLPSLSAGLGGIVGTLALERIFLPLLGKLGTIFIISGVLLLQILLYGNTSLGSFVKKVFKFPYLLIKLIYKALLKNPLVTKLCTRTRQSEADRTAKSPPLEPISPAQNLHGVKIFEETNIDKTNLVPKKRDLGYIFPGIDLLKHCKNTGNSKENCEQVAQKLVEVLAQFGVHVTPGEIHKGPVITRYEVTPDAGIRVEKIANLDKNIALGLAAKSVRIIAPVPGKSCVGVELPNKDPASVHLREILESKTWAESTAAIPIVLGRSVTGDPMIHDLAKMPHLLIAGATGSGKTVCINAIIASLLYHASPEDLRFIMVDPKIVEMQNYNRLPHMLVPVVTDPKKVPSALKWLIGEMELRYQIFAKAGVRNIANYNEKLKDLQKLAEEDGTEYKKFPYIVCIIDELADLMMVAPGDIETYIARLAQLARAAGIHLVLATQRPSVNVITGIIKANLPCRIAFKVSSKVDSRTILDTGGAEALLGQGDMLFSPPGASGLLRAQGALVSDDEINGIVDYLYQKNGGPKFEESVQEQIENDAESSSEDNEKWDDDLIPRALEIIRANDRASTSFLQRKLKIGYNRAARIMDTLREQGLVGTEIED
ncbi:MAG: DNA translocase FtsK 4TM domain-containing protein [Puniceicoccales bacterium]|jgi:S-DNA-T family DNA segregation ATPase FtsK/SpoIIIE|nr:DNA translocase FtsK 4TM domain-containing protein [Puniceicoccales bacterium]